MEHLQPPMTHANSAVPSEGTPSKPESGPPAALTAKNSRNPFSQGSYDASHSTDLEQADPAQNFPYQPTSIPQNILRKNIFKTSNRILDDMRFTPALLEARALGEIQSDVTSLLKARPIEYKNLISVALVKKQPRCLISNNVVSQAMPVSRKEYPNSNMVVTTVRGLIVGQRPGQVNHFKVKFLDCLQKKSYSSIGKHQFHLIDRAAVSVDDLNLLEDASVASDSLLDDAFFKTINNFLNQLLRVSVYSAEFTPEDLAALTDQDIIEARYLKSLDVDADKSAQTSIPNAILCYQTLLKVLKGPIMLAPEEAIHTIKRSKTSLDAKLDIDLLFNKLSFTLGDDSDVLVPPNLSINSALKESYIRKSNEIIYLGKGLKVNQTNEFDVTYSFNDNLSPLHTALGEFDKNQSMTMARSDDTNKLPDFISLSCCSYSPDELIIWSYEQTVNSDPVNKSSYVDSFKEIFSHRPYGSSNRLRSYYNNQHSKGLMYGISDYRNALKEIGIEGVPDDVVIDEDTIIEMYKASCKDNPKNYTYLNKNLSTIATIRNSETIKSFIAAEVVPQSIALSELRIEDVTEDEVAVTAFEFRLDEVMQSVNFNAQSAEVKMLQKCLLSIAVFRKSYILMTYVDKHMPELLQTQMPRSLGECYEILESDVGTTDFDLISKFQTLVANSSQDDEVDVRVLRYCFNNIAMGRQSDILLSFLQDGKVDASLLPAENWPAGLDNIGNTCYLNSLLQYYFSIKPLRDVILDFDETKVDRNNLLARKIGGRSVENSEIDRSIQFIYRLQELFKEMITTNKRFIQPSKELVYLSFLPLSQHVTFKEASAVELVDAVVLDDDVEPVQEQDLIEMDSPMDVLEPAEKPKLEISSKESPQTKIMSIGQEQIESAIEIGRQQDVTECIENVTFQIETALEPDKLDEDGEQYDLVKKLFCGKTKQTILPLEEKGSPRISTERFFSLIINVGDHPRNIYDALDNYFGENVVNLGSEMVKMSLTILELPEILQFHVQRVLFDREKLMAYKSLEVIPFGESIYLDRYLDTEDSEILAKRQEVFEWKTEIKSLEEEKGSLLEVDPVTKISVIDTLIATVRYLRTVVMISEELSIKDETIVSLEEEVTWMKQRLESIDNQVKRLQDRISDQFTAYLQVGYSLFAIFIHRGEASYGHYWVYIKDLKRNIYRKYNDDTVTEVPASEIFNFTETNTATPYYMVYVKDDLQQDYIEPLKREIRC